MKLIQLLGRDGGRGAKEWVKPGLVLGEGDDIADGLGMTGDGPYSHYFAKVKSDEFTAHHHEVTASEIDQYLTLF